LLPAGIKDIFMDTIGLIAAMPSESRALTRRVRGGKSIRITDFRGFEFELGGHRCALVTSGMGIERANKAASGLIDTCKPSLMISFGIAGAVRENLHIGDVILAAATCSLNDVALGPARSLGSLPEHSLRAIEDTLSAQGVRFLRGTAVTTRGSAVKDEITANLINPILEMETAGILDACSEKGIPLVVLRAISDGPMAPIPFDLGQVMDANSNLSIGKLVKEVIKNPRLLLLVGRMTRNSRMAAENAAMATFAALDAL
jgi:nucleoside phosphorylase